MKKRYLGLLGGMAAGVVDATPMALMKMPWDATLSAFVFWGVCGFLISAVDFKTAPVLRGVATAGLVLLPVAVLVAFKEPASLIPMSVSTVVLGGALGFIVQRWGN